MVVKLTRHVRSIVLVTTKDEPRQLAINQQEARLDEIRLSLAQRRVQLVIKYDPKLHDREITFSNGWIVKIGRGLDYFKKPGI